MHGATVSQKIGMSEKIMMSQKNKSNIVFGNINEISILYVLLAYSFLLFLSETNTVPSRCFLLLFAWPSVNEKLIEQGDSAI